MRRNVAVITGFVLILLVFVLIQYGFLDFGSPEPRRIFYADNISHAHQIIIDRFNALHKGKIEVVPVNLPFNKFTTNERKELLARSLRNKSDRIDVFAVDLIWVPRFSKWSEPLTRYVSNELLSNNLESALESCSFESTLVALPLYLDIGMMYYRRDMIEKIAGGKEIEARLAESITWEELIALSKRPEFRGVPFYAFQAKDYEGLVCNYFELVAELSPEQLDRNSFHLESPAAKEALNMMVAFAGPHGISPKQVTDFDENRSYDYMLKNDGLFWRGWPNFLENYATFYADSLKIRKIRRAALPHFQGKSARSVFGGWNLMVSKYSTSKPEAVEFIKFFQLEESQKLMFEVGGYLPTAKSIYDNQDYLKQHPDLAYYKTLIDRGFHRPALMGYTRQSDVVSNYLHRAIKGEISVDVALREASRAISSNGAMPE